jgi:hypothetical protein
VDRRPAAGFDVPVFHFPLIFGQRIGICRREKRRRAAAVQDASRFALTGEQYERVLECASPSVFAARQSAATARRRLAIGLRGLIRNMLDKLLQPMQPRNVAK